MVVMDFGRRVRPVSIIPREAAWEARKRKSMLWAFSELRAWGGRLVGGGRGLVGGCGWGRGGEGGGTYHCCDWEILAMYNLRAVRVDV